MSKQMDFLTRLKTGVPETPNTNWTKYADAWQLMCTTPIERNRYILENEMWVDCSFLVGSQVNKKEIKCHKLFLSHTSEKLHGMVYGDNQITTYPHPLPDVEPSAFKAMLDYIYCDEVNMDSREEAEALLYLARKFEIRHLAQECHKYLCDDQPSEQPRAM